MAGSYTCGLLAQGKGHISEGCGQFQAGSKQQQCTHTQMAHTVFMLSETAVPVAKSVFTCFLKAPPCLAGSYFIFLQE